MKSKTASLLAMSACLWCTPVVGQQPTYYQYGGGLQSQSQAYGTLPAQFSSPPVGSGTRGGPAPAPLAPIPSPLPQAMPAHSGVMPSPSYGSGIPSSVSPSYSSPTPPPSYSAPSYTTPGYSTPGYTVPMQPSYQAAPSSAPYMPAPMDAVPVDGGVAWDTAGGCDSCDSGSTCDPCGSCGAASCACSCSGGMFGSLFGGRHGSGGCGLGAGMGLASLFSDSGPTRPARMWGGIEYLYWWNKNRSVPVLATTSPVGTPLADAGVIGELGTRILFGGGDYDDDPQGGVRGTLGLWLDQRQTVGVVGRAFSFGPEDIDFSAASNGSPILARPFLDAGIGTQDSLVVAFPNSSRGRINIHTENEITGFDLMLRKMLYYGNCNRVDFVGGYHHTEITDLVRAGHFLVSEDPNGRVPVGTRIESADIFRAQNEFDGGSIGLMSQGYDGRLTWNLLTKISFGNTKQQMTIRGESTSTIPGFGSAAIDQGLLALDTNSGVYERDEFTIVPEVDLSVAYHISTSIQLSVGYSLIYWSNAVMAGDAIDLGINPTQIDGNLIGVARPRYTMEDESFWAHGLTFGLSGRY